MGTLTPKEALQVIELLREINGLKEDRKAIGADIKKLQVEVDKLVAK